MAQLLVVEDDPTIGALLESGLRANGHQVRWVRSGRGALAAGRGDEFDLVLLDLGLPDLDGVSVCRELRLLQPGSVLVMLTARQDEMDVVVGLDAGADDYLTKPFSLVELLARLRAHLRRAAPAAAETGPLTFGDLVVDLAARRCLVRQREVELRPKEFDLLARLATEPEVAVSRETLMSDVWDANWFGSTKTLDVTMASLRRRLQLAGEAAGDARLPAITTLRGHGYRFEPPR